MVRGEPAPPPLVLVRKRSSLRRGLRIKTSSRRSVRQSRPPQQRQQWFAKWECQKRRGGLPGRDKQQREREQKDISWWNITAIQIILILGPVAYDGPSKTYWQPGFEVLTATSRATAFQGNRLTLMAIWSVLQVCDCKAENSHLLPLLGKKAP